MPQNRYGGSSPTRAKTLGEKTPAPGELGAYKNEKDYPNYFAPIEPGKMPSLKGARRPGEIPRIRSPFMVGNMGVEIPQQLEVASQTRKFHPDRADNGIVEQVIKNLGYASGSLIGPDIPYLEQYMHPEHDVIPRTNLRPTQATPQPYVYRSIGATGPGKGKYVDVVGQGQTTQSSTPEYNSEYDIWDFNRDGNRTKLSPWEGDWRAKLANQAEPAINWFMKKVGTPFVTYDRYKKTEKGQ